MQTAIRHPLPDNPSDVELAARIAAHDQNAFVILMRRHNQRLFRTARSILHNDAEAEDAVQESYLQAYRSINTFRGDAKLSTWLTRIVVNQSLARIRRAGRRAQITSLYADEENNHDVSEAEMKPSTAESPEGSAMRAQARALLESSIDALPEQFRTVFVMRAVEEMSGEEVALCLGIPEATVRSRFFRARSQLRSALLDHVDSAFGDVFSFDGARCDRIVATVLDRLNIAPSDAL
jgi:RNA polymerase sigma-70 factor (ECF subfamily)